MKFTVEDLIMHKEGINRADTLMQVTAPIVSDYLCGRDALEPTNDDMALHGDIIKLFCRLETAIKKSQSALGNIIKGANHE